MPNGCPPTSSLELSDDVSQAVRSLLQDLGPERLCRLAELLAAVRTETGYGDVTIVVTDGRVVGLRRSNSFR